MFRKEALSWASPPFRQPKSPLSVWLWPGLTLTTAVVCLVTAVAYLARWLWLFELFSHFRPYYFLLLLPAAVVFATGRRWPGAAVAGAFALLNLASLATSFHAPNRVAAAPLESYRLLTFNLHIANQAFTAVPAMIMEQKPDFVALQEVGEKWTPWLAPLESLYPYHYQVTNETGFKTHLYSRLSWDEVMTFQAAPGHRPSIVARYRLGERPFTLIATHAPPPLGAASFAHRNDQLQALARLAAEQPGTVLLLGDFNLSPWSPFFADLRRESGLVDGRAGFGLQGTWPAGWPLLRLPIDHMLATPDVVVSRFTSGPALGSDHLPVRIDFQFR